MNDWKTIDTAPRDGTEILTCDAQCRSWSVRYWGEGDDGDDAWQPRIRGVFPTHWMDLPALPQGDTGKEDEQDG